MARAICGWLWLAWALYWAWAARGASAAKWQQPRREKLFHRGALAAGFLLIFGPHGRPALGLNEAWAAGTGLGLAFAVWARVFLGRQWSAEVTLKEGHELVETGPYRRVRHPIYTGFLAAAWCSAAAAGSPWSYAGAALITGTIVWKLLREEQVLAGEFGPVWQRYQARTARLVPGVF